MCPLGSQGAQRYVHNLAVTNKQEGSGCVLKSQLFTAAYTDQLYEDSKIRQNYKSKSSCLNHVSTAVDHFALSPLVTCQFI